MGATDLIFLLIIQSTVIFLLLGGSLIIAKTLGIYGAGAAIGMAAGAGKAFRGYVGKGALRMGALPARGLNKLATAPGRIPYAGPVFRALLKPLTAATGAAVRVTDKEKTERQESWKKLSPIALAETYRGAVNPLTRKEILKAAGESGKLDKFSEGELQTAYSQFKDKPADARAYNNVVKARPDLIEKDSSLSPADKRTRMTDALSRMSEKDIEEKLTWGEREMTAAIRKHGEAARNAVNQSLATMGPPDVQFRNLYDNNKSFIKGLFRNPALALQFGVLRTNMERAAARAYPDWEHRLGIT